MSGLFGVVVKTWVQYIKDPEFDSREQQGLSCTESCTWETCTLLSCTWKTCTLLSCTQKTCTLLSCTWETCTLLSCTWETCTQISCTLLSCTSRSCTLQLHPLDVAWINERARYPILLRYTVYIHDSKWNSMLISNLNSKINFYLRIFEKIPFQNSKSGLFRIHRIKV